MSEFREIFRKNAHSKGFYAFVNEIGTPNVFEVFTYDLETVTAVRANAAPMSPHIARYKLVGYLSDEVFLEVFGRSKTTAEPLMSIIDDLRYNTEKCEVVCRFVFLEDCYEPDLKKFKKYGKNHDTHHCELLRTTGGRWCVVEWLQLGRDGQWFGPHLKTLTEVAAREILREHEQAQFERFFGESVQDA
jgi:hypothetical protein